jgi:hypothetical protein
LLKYWSEMIPKTQSALGTLLLLGILSTVFAFPLPLPERTGTTDFRPYWASSYLLARGQDFSDPALIDAVERTLTGWERDYTMSAWFAPTGNLVLLPFTLLPFTRAAYYWLLVNIAVVFASALLLWRGPQPKVWIALVAAFSFSMTLLSLIYGQVNTLVLLGLALYLHFNERQRPAAAGVSLALTTIKPHLVILALPLLLLDGLRRRQWRALAGFGGALAACSLLLFALNPQWPVRFWRLVSGGMELVRETPTLNGLLVLAGEGQWGKWLWLPAMLFAIAGWQLKGNRWQPRPLLDVAVMASLIVSPVGWSYDQVLLLLPVWSVLGGAADGSLSKADALAVMLALLAADAVTFYQRILTPSEVWFFWTPLVIAGVYAYAWWRKNDQSPVLEEK